jgi:hypothetical protein
LVGQYLSWGDVDRRPVIANRVAEYECRPRPPRERAHRGRIGYGYEVAVPVVPTDAGEAREQLMADSPSEDHIAGADSADGMVAVELAVDSLSYESPR